MKKAIAACLVFSLSCPIGLVTANDEVPRRVPLQNQGTEKWTVRDADGKQVYVLERPKETGRHRNLGMVTGLLAGMFFGGYTRGSGAGGFRPLEKRGFGSD